MTIFRNCIRLLALPLAISLMAMNILWTATLNVPLGAFLPVTMVLAFTLIVLFIVNAVIDFKDFHGAGGRRWGGLFHDIAVAASYGVIPLTVGFAGVTGSEGWGLMGLAIVMMIVVVALATLGLVFVVITSVGGRYANSNARNSAIFTAAVFLPLVLSIILPFMAPVFLAVSGVCLFMSLTFGGMAIFEGQILTRPGGIPGVAAWKTQGFPSADFVDNRVSNTQGVSSS